MKSMNRSVREYIYVFKLDGQNGYEIYSQLRSKIPEVARYLTVGDAYLVDWNFDEELKYLFIVVRCCCEEENIGLWLHSLLEKLLPGISIEKRRMVSGTKRLALNSREKLLASLAAKIVKSKTREVRGVLDREGVKLTKPELSMLLLIFSYLSRGFSETLSEIYVYFYPHFLEEYTLNDITLSFQEILRGRLIVKEDDVFKLTERGNRVVKAVYSMIEKELEDGKHEIFSDGVADINTVLKRVIRKDGEFEDLSIEKILASLLKCGVKEEDALRVLDNFVSVVKIMSNGLSRDDVVEAVKLALDRIDKTRLYSSRFEFYMNTCDHLLIEDKNGKLKPLSLSDIEKTLREKWFKHNFEVDEDLLRNLAFKVFENLRFIYSSASPQTVFIQSEQSITRVPKDFIEYLLDNEVRIRLPHYYKIVKSRDPDIKRKEVINELVRNSASLLREILAEKDLRRMCDLFNAAAYTLVAALLLLLFHIPTVFHEFNCNRLIGIVKNMLEEKDKRARQLSIILLDKVLVFTKTALEIYHLDLTREVVEEEKFVSHISFISELGLEIIEYLRGLF